MYFSEQNQPLDPVRQTARQVGVGAYGESGFVRAGGEGERLAEKPQLQPPP
jgi:hypothetical protein